MRWLVGVLAVVVVALALGWALFVPIADWLASHDVGHVTGALRMARLQMARDAARGRLLTFGAGLFAMGALIFTALNFNLLRRNSEQADRWQRRTHELTEQGQVTDRYTKAIEQLGSNTADVIIGGIYALERIARDSPRDHPTVMEVLAACIREHSREPLPRTTSGVDTPERAMRPDIQAAVTVIGRRDTTHDGGQINLRHVYLPHADLPGAKLFGVDLEGADLTGANLTGVKLKEANLRDAHFEGANFAPAEVPIPGVAGGYTYTASDLRGADLAGADLTDAVLAGADFKDATLHRTILCCAILGNADLTGANLAGAVLAGAVLTGANFTGADLTGADLTDASLMGANLTGANLTGVDLTDARLGMANFTRAILHGANLTQAMLIGANFTGARLTGANLTRAYLSADLTDARLGNANLTSADLSRAVLIRADLTGARLTSADLTDADLTSADLTNARWPKELPVPDSWVRDPGSSRLRRADADTDDYRN